MALTNIAIKQAKAKEKPYKLADSAGLYLLVQPNGAKYWRLKYRFAGKEKVLALGVYPQVSLAEARVDRDDARKLLSKSKDPIEEKRRKRRKQQAEAENAFEKIAREWFKKQQERWGSGHAMRVLNSLEKNIFPSLGTRPINEISIPELLDVIKRIEKRGAYDVAARIVQRVSAIYKYAIRTERATSNPAADLSDTLTTRKVSHRPAMERKDLPGFMAKLDTYPGQPVTKYALQLLMLTFVRPGELRGATWDEFDLERAEWRIPGERMKMDIPLLVPLSRQALKVLKELQQLTGRFKLVFPSQSNIKKPISENTMLFALYRMGYRGKATPHGFRATASTILNESGFHHDAIERQLAHTEKNKVRAAYHRAEYLEERKRMMQWWADFLDGLKSGKNVVPIMSKN